MNLSILEVICTYILSCRDKRKNVVNIQNTEKLK